MRSDWEKLITGYLENREALVCVVVIIDVRHELKEHDRNLIEWLRYYGLTFILVYTKADKLSGNKLKYNAAALDAALTVTPAQRILFSAKTGIGCEQLKTKLASYCER